MQAVFKGYKITGQQGLYPPANQCVRCAPEWILTGGSNGICYDCWLGHKNRYISPRKPSAPPNVKAMLA
ncbi:hypothetical protein AC249_AIPGENE11199 [Exaiptasia diaphana]|nr:hypothetical protein AC249_AIPGENE11199 [Exaiptasia diaphana]